MSKWGEGLRKVFDFFFSPCPTLFDLCAVLGVIGMGFMPSDLKGLYFVFYAFFITMIGFHVKCVRNLQSAGLTLICLIGFASLFIHSFEIYRKSLTFTYLNTYLMFEGFIYVFSGCMLFYVLVSKARNLRLFIFTLPIAALTSIKYAIYGGQMSLLIALVVGFSVYLLLQRRYFLLGSLICVSLCVIALWPLRFGNGTYNLREWLWMKFSLRPSGWWALCQLIWQHPFVGEGFNKYIGQDNNAIVIWNSTKTVVMNCTYRPNDYLNIAQIYGLPILIGIGWFIKDSVLRLRRSWMLAPFVAICALLFVQITMFWTDKALAVVCVVSMFYTET